VFVESRAERQPGELLGRTEHGLMVSLRGPPELVGGLVLARIQGATAFGLSGELARDAS
jgi:hypothetical protein